MKWELIQITDLHYGDVFVDDDKEPTGKKFRDNLKNRLPNAIKALKGAPPDALLITGDLTVRGNTDAMSEAGDVLNPLIAAMRKESRIVAAVPGNHDVTWALDHSSENLEKKFDAFRKVVENWTASVSLLPINSGSDDELRFPLGAKPVALDKERKIVVVCINSAMRCGEFNRELYQEAKKHLNKLAAGDEGGTTVRALDKWIKDRCVRDIAHVTTQQLSVLSEQLAEIEKEINLENMANQSLPAWSEFLKVAILHHHLVGFATEATEHKVFEATLDAAKVLDMLGKHRIDLVVTGHKHQTYQTRHTYADSCGDHVILIAGGATVLGDLPRAGSEKRGINRLVAMRDKSGTLRLECAVLPLDNFGGELASARQGSDSNRVGVISGGGLRAERRSPVIEPYSCASYSAQPFLMESADPTWAGDHSREWMLWLNVASCVASSGFINSVMEVEELVSGIDYMSTYHLYGRFDILVRYCQIEGRSPEEGRRLHERIIGRLKEEGQWVADELFDIRRVDYVHPKRGHHLWRQKNYEATRKQRAFLIGRYNANNAEATIGMQKKKETLEQTRACCADFPGSWSLHFADRAFVLEAEISCGRYYDLQLITRTYERWLDQPPWNKETQLAYDHDEWSPSAGSGLDRL